MTSNRKYAKRDLKWTRYVTRLEKITGKKIDRDCECGEVHPVPRMDYPPGYIDRRAVTRKWTNGRWKYRGQRSSLVEWADDKQKATPDQA